jgi:PAS domain S-box-containing protein
MFPRFPDAMFRIGVVRTGISLRSERIVNTFGREMAEARPRNGMLEIPALLASAARIGGVDAAALLMQDPGAQGATAVAWHGLSQREASAIIPFAQSAYLPSRVDSPCAIDDLDAVVTDPDFTTLAIRDAGFRAMRVSPIRDSAGAPFAVLLALRRSPMAGHQSSDELIDLVAGHAAALAQVDFARRQQALSEAELRAVVDSLGEAIMRFDAMGTIEAASPSSESVLGRPPESLVGTPIDGVLQDVDASICPRAIATYAAGGRAPRFGRTVPAKARRADGRSIPVELVVCEVERRARFVAILRDNEAERIADARLRQADRLTALGTLAAGLGHDMNNVLLPVRAHLNALERSTAAPTDVPASAGEHVAEIRSGIEYLQGLADGLHSLANDPGPANGNGDGTDLNAWWARVQPLLRQALPPLTVVASDIPPGLPRVDVAERALTQAVLNLFVNAGEAITAARRNAPGKVTLRAACTADAQSIEVSVTDTGCGMSAETRARAFDMFFTTKTRQVGSGLGLALVQRVAREAGGSVAIDSVPGEGTVIRMAVPHCPLPQAVTDAHVAISLADSRAGAFMESAMRARGMRMVTLDDASEADAWIADPRIVPARDAVRWLARRAGRTLVLYGEPVPAARRTWRGVSAGAIPRHTDFDTLLIGVDQACSIIQRRRDDE